MALSPYVFDATAENFSSLVLGNSGRGPVLVHFWSPKAGPCMILMPRLVRLAAEFGGKFLLVMLNVDAYARVAHAWSVTSVPTVKLFRHGSVVQTVHGAESESEFRQLIEAQLARPSDALHAQAVRQFNQGQTEQAYAILAQAALEDPDNSRLPVDLAKLMLLNGEPARAQTLLRSLPEAVRQREDVVQLLAHAGLLVAGQEAAPVAALKHALEQAPDNAQARYQLAASLLMQDDFAGAMDELLSLLKAAPDFERGAAHQALLAILALPHLPAELAATYRSRLGATLHH